MIKIQTVFPKKKKIHADFKKVKKCLRIKRWCGKSGVKSAFKIV